MSTYNKPENTIPSPSVPTIPLIPTPPSSIPTTTLGQKTNLDKIEEQTASKKTPHYLIKASFMITYILLLTTATVTFIEAMRTKTPAIRHILNLETCISLIAGYFYSVFLAQIETFEKDNKPVDWSDIIKTRYIDWCITTPIMLFCLSVFLATEHNKKVGLYTILTIILLNYLMLLAGYLGELKVISIIPACIGGFIPFFAMFYIIFVNFVDRTAPFSYSFLFYFYLFIWGGYGLVYLLDDISKNICMNILDCTAKCVVGLGIWLYYSKTIITSPSIIP